MAKVTYQDAGVNLEVYEEAMARLPKLMHRTFSPRVKRLDGGFAGMFQLDFANKLFARNYQEPVLISCTDGVGTKLKVAILCDRHDTVGIDLVAMSINDALCCGAEPLFFLDYVAMSHDDPTRLEQIVRGVSDGCLEADVALLGGETAIMPDIYGRGDYDLAGFCVGVVEKAQVIDGTAIKAGDAVLGIASSGLHSNGYSLVRKVVFEIAGLKVEDHVAEANQTVGELLLTPTRIYTKPLCALQAIREAGQLHGIAHITGGGILGNLERILPAGTRAVLNRGCWQMPPVFPWLQKLGEIEDAEMDRVFNMGIGMTLVIDTAAEIKVCEKLAELGLGVWNIGKIVAGEQGAVWS